MEQNEKFTRPEKFGPPEIEPSEITYDEELDFLGQGSFGAVYRGRCRQTVVAVKVPAKQNLSAQEFEDFRKEVGIMSQIFHPNIVLFMGACMRPRQIRIVTELMVTDLEKLLHSPKGKTLSLFSRIKMARDAAKGMSWLHGISNIIHRDLKPANILIDNNYNVKVSDFGFSEILKDTDALLSDPETAGIRGTPIWMAPEVMLKKKFNKAIDVYSFGIILWEVLTLDEPFKEYEAIEPFKHDVAENGHRPKIPSDCLPQLKNLMEDCWNTNPEKRPDFTTVVERLNEILISLAIPDPSGARFWRIKFLQGRSDLLEKVPWNEFEEAVAQYSSIRISDLSILKPYLVEDKNNDGDKKDDKSKSSNGDDNESQVSLNSFQTAITWFGHFFERETAKDTLRMVSSLVNELWFHGSIDQHEADGRLVIQPQGSYLVRLSKTYPHYPFTLSLKNSQHLRIQKIIKDDGSCKYVIHGQEAYEFDTVSLLVQGTSKILGLQHPCPKAPAQTPYYTLSISN
eukprot:TRINITY_DN5978_c0_g1_i1.p1 TRINITY_DN5978_c0_g1~~TRINITY_DN5978_c0_g1_i1.p1  ORF type:complete len:512 (+),score=76.63 TRINITY_DN5978_c0_g1_i1:109-1644(+)